jgi:molybdate transport system substrate-binding protein
MAPARDLVVLSAGAAKGLVEALAGEFRQATGAGVDGTFGAVGTIREQFLGPGGCDVLILTAAMLDALAADGRVARAGPHRRCRARRRGAPADRHSR